MLPSLDIIMGWVGLDIIQILKTEPEIMRGITERTLRNWDSRRSVPRESVIRRLTDRIRSVARKQGASVPHLDSLFQDWWERRNEPQLVFFVQWDSLIDGIELSQNPSMRLFAVEARRLVDLMRELRPLVAARDIQALAKRLRAANIPMPESTLTAIRHLETANTFSDELALKGLGPIFLVNTLYLIACLDTERGGLQHLCPTFEGDSVALSMSRWLDGVREDKNFPSDRALGEFLLPNFSPENAAREVKKWRQGEMISWKAVRTMVRRHDAEELYEVFTIIRLLHGVYAVSSGDEAVRSGLDSRALFGSAAYLQEFAREREKALAAE